MSCHQKEVHVLLKNLEIQAFAATEQLTIQLASPNTYKNKEYDFMNNIIYSYFSVILIYTKVCVFLSGSVHERCAQLAQEWCSDQVI